MIGSHSSGWNHEVRSEEHELERTDRTVAISIVATDSLKYEKMKKFTSTASRGEYIV